MDDLLFLHNSFDRYSQEIVSTAHYHGLVGNSLFMRELFFKLESIKELSGTILLEGPFGVGKRSMAYAIYLAMQDSFKERYMENLFFQSIDLAMIDLNNLTFNSAQKRVIFLQNMHLLRREEEDLLLKIVADSSVVRIILSSTIDSELILHKMHGSLAQYFTGVKIAIPPLSKRKEDIVPLLYHFLDRCDQRKLLSQEAEDLLKNYPFTDALQIVEVMERVMANSKELIAYEDLNFLLTKEDDLPREGINLKEELRKREDSYILQALQRSRGNKNKAAKLLGINRTTLVEKLKKRGHSFLGQLNS